MTAHQHQQLTILISTLTEQNNVLDMIVNKIIDLFQEDGHIVPAPNEQQRRRSSNIFDGSPTSPPGNTTQRRRSSSIFDGSPYSSPENTTQRRRSSTYNEKGLINNVNTMLYENRHFE
ncbi:unnamed protein product [Rotaria sp. Silwood1]|nr:unnamed protein product [Rotaria sp. Silwood1]CAF1638274.1 unnamed protein product [Rotaria sp. Silwood1]CAF3891898.1 unnamed protein product [Rotaria sp. Silwood1]CAF3940029.1 unnamed protein product [Rotaria sp. Silwood1]CAF4960106.1 unnamed protein product [Rotaria sp. Silwood1]